MASAVKAKLSRSTSGSNSADPELQQEKEKYRLIVTAGPSYDEHEHQPVHVNTEKTTYIENDFIRAKIVVRVRGFKGLPSSCPPDADSYFNHPLHERDQYSLGFSFVPKVDIPSENTVWGNDLDHPIRNRIPPGFNTAFRIVKEFIDPGLQCDVYADEPWLYGPSLSCWFALRIGDEVAPDEDFPFPGVITEGADGSGQQIRESLNLPSNNEKRRKHFLNQANRQAFTFQKGRLYQGDFYNPYLDFANFALKLPGFSLKVIKYIGDKTHCLRYVFKNRETGELFFNVNFKLLWGEQLERAIERDRQGEEGHRGGAEVNGQDGGNERGEEDKAHDGERQTTGIDDTTQAGKRQLHPGDHAAMAESMAANAKDPVDEIDELLKNTSTSQKRDGLHLKELD